MGYVLGIDLGTGSLKGLLMDRQGALKAEASADYPLYHEKKGYSEQDPEDWWQAALEVIKKMQGAAAADQQVIEAISFSGQMHSMVLLDEAGEPLRRAILWNDVRTTPQCREIEERYGSQLLEKTKNVALEGFTLPKILWVMENEPELWSKAAGLLLPKDYLAYRLTGQQGMEYSDASGTLLLDLANESWDPEILEVFGIKDSLLPPLHRSIDQMGVLQESVAAELGIENEVIIIAGGADNACGALGAGIISEDVALSSIGTSGVFLSYEGSQIKEYGGKLHFFDHVIPDSYYSMGVILSAGQSLSWFKETFAQEVSFDALMAEAATVAPGAAGLLFTPYIMGERTPHIDGQVRGSFIGCDAKHQRKHFTRAVIEGITFSLAESQLIMKESAGKVFREIVATGGGAKSPVWLQIQADIFGVPVVTLQREEGPGLGAAMLAAIGAGWYDSVLECVEAFVGYGAVYQPIPENVEKYQRYFDLYREVYPSTKTICHKLSALEAE